MNASYCIPLPTSGIIIENYKFKIIAKEVNYTQRNVADNEGQIDFWASLQRECVCNLFFRTYFQLTGLIFLVDKLIN